MNIFYIDTDPVIAAKSMVDKHVVKMILESAQLLSTTHRVLDGIPYIDGNTGRKTQRWHLNDSRENVLYKATHVNHPSAIWSRQSVENYNWLVEHFFALGDEYTYRYEKTHKCFTGDLGYMLQSPPKNLTQFEMTKIPCAMDAQYIISDDPVINYRNYYRIGKKDLHVWKNRQPPEWINE